MIIQKILEAVGHALVRDILSWHFPGETGNHENSGRPLTRSIFGSVPLLPLPQNYAPNAVDSKIR